MMMMMYDSRLNFRMLYGDDGYNNNSLYTRQYL